MKKLVSILLAAVMLFGALPIFAAAEPYSVLSSFNGDGKIGVVVKANENFEKDFVLIAVLYEGDTVCGVKTLTKAQLNAATEISFDAVENGQIKLYAWDSLEGLSPANEDYLSSLTYDEVIRSLKTVNDYWIKRNSVIYSNSNPWDVAVFHTGNMQAYYMTGDETYRNYSTLWSNVNLWQSHNYPGYTNADNICCFQTYIDLYNIDKDESYLENVKPQVDSIVNSGSVSYWNWIDTFYMGGPVFTKMYKLTGDRAYLDKMYNMIKYTADNLDCYDRNDMLWFRDESFINRVSENGEKVFWSRGDGWVFAAFARIIEDLPDDYEHKDYFVNIFKNMASALKATQCDEGAWHESLLDKNYNPTCEESGTGFFVYGMLWGINNGYLEEIEYLNCALKGWKWLTEVAMQENGLIGYVQQIGAMPTKDEITAFSTEDYAYANFVFAASELAKYLGGVKGDVLPYLKKKLTGNTYVYKKDSIYALVGGEIVSGDMPFLTDEGILKEGKYVALQDFIPEGMYAYEYEDLCVISEYAKPFNRTETNLLNVLSDILSSGQFPERPYSDPDRIIVKDWDNMYEEKEYTDGNITVSELPQPQNGPKNMIDGSLSTYWTAYVQDDEVPCSATFDLGKKYNVSKIGIAFNKGNQRTTGFSVSVSADGENYTEVLPKMHSSGETTAVEYYSFDAREAQYVRIYGYQNSDEGVKYWFSPTEVVIYSENGELLMGEAPQEEPEKPWLEGLKKADFTASVSTLIEPQNGPDKLNDGNFDSYCSLLMKDAANPPYIELDLGEVKDVKYAALAFRLGNVRKYTLHIETSEDGVIYTKAVQKGASAGNTTDYEYFSIDENARYIRIYGYYNSVNNWFCITEAAVYTTE